MIFKHVLSILSLLPYFHLVTLTTGTAIPIPIPIPDIDVDVIRTSGTFNLTSTGLIPVFPSSPDPTILPRATPSGMSYFSVWRFTSRTTFSVEFTVRDTAGDSHPVYAEATVYDINDRATFVLRCNNNNGNGNEVNCGTRSYTHGSTVVAVAAHVCVNIQLGTDRCGYGGTVDNPKYP